ncbi:MAG: hypothetical protein PHZ17_01625 [Sulfurovum sp.]|nr:hypothetical protein [Sulfurovum sp.]
MIPFKDFYYAVANKLLDYKNDRSKLIGFLKELQASGLQVTPLNDQYPKGNTIELEDIDPFTFFGVFNRGIADDNRIKILKRLKEFFDISEEIPESFDGVPVLNNQKSWFFAYKYDKLENDIDLLWELFESFMSDKISGDLFDRCLEIKGVKQNITMAFYWIKPNEYIALDKNTVEFIKQETSLENMDINKLKFSG